MKDSCIALCTLFVLIALFSSCGGQEKKANPNAIQLNIDGSSTVYPITEAVAKSYSSEFDYFNISVAVSGTGGGFEKFASKDIMINNASRKIKEKEASICDENGVSFMEFQVGNDGIAVVVNKENDWVSKLTIVELELIWKEGGAQRWSDVRPEWPSEEIVLYGPGQASGTFDFFAEAVLTEGVSIRSDYKKSENDNLLVTGINSNRNALGFFGLGYFSGNSDKLKLVPIGEGDSPVAPSASTVADGSYSLSRPLFIYINETFASTESGSHFLTFYLDHADQHVTESGYVPLPKASYAANISRLKAFRQ